MGAHVFVVPDLQSARIGATVIMHGDEARHAAQVVRVRPGEHIELVDGLGRRVGASVVRAERDAVEVSVDSVADEPAPSPRITVVQALAKGDRGEQAVELLTEVGVDRIVPWSASRSVARWDAERSQRGLERWRRTALAATKQARRSRVPSIAAVHSTDDLVPLLAGVSLSLVLDEEARTAISAYDVPATGDIAVIVGPEGGITDLEREELAAAGALPARLGPSVMRTSTAGAVAAAILLSSTPRWGHARMEP